MNYPHANRSHLESLDRWERRTHHLRSDQTEVEKRDRVQSFRLSSEVQSKAAEHGGVELVPIVGRRAATQVVGAVKAPVSVGRYILVALVSMSIVSFALSFASSSVFTVDPSVLPLLPPESSFHQRIARSTSTNHAEPTLYLYL